MKSKVVENNRVKFYEPEDTSTCTGAIQQLKDFDKFFIKTK